MKILINKLHNCCGTQLFTKKQLACLEFKNSGKLPVTLWRCFILK